MAIHRHGIYPQDIIPPRSSYFAAGRFGRMFGKLPPFAADTRQVRAALMEIGQPAGIMDAQDDLSDPVALIANPALSANNPNNPEMTAGMTFLGQFIDHDITFDPTSHLERQVDPEQVANFWTPTLALDNLHGRARWAALTSMTRTLVGGSSSWLSRSRGRQLPASTCRATAR
jgi:hypothetical protein